MNGDTEGGCAFCGKRWSLLRALGRGVVYVPTADTGSAMFVLCEPCWVSATVEDRVAAYLWRTRSGGWHLHGPAELARIRAYVERAICADDVEIAVRHGGQYVVTRQRPRAEEIGRAHS